MAKSSVRARVGPVIQPLGERSARKRQAILEAATALFYERGYVGTSMDDIAAGAGVSKPTVYRFFTDKKALLSDIVLATVSGPTDRFRSAIEQVGGSDDLERDLERLALGYIALVTQPAVLRLRRLVIGASHQLPDLAQAYYERGPERTLQALSAAFARLAGRGLLRVDDAKEAASQFAFLVIGRVLDRALFCGDHPYRRRELHAQAAAGVRMFLSVYRT